MEKFIDFLTSTYSFFISSWGLTIALVGYIAQKFFVPQILEFRTIIRRARYDVIYYANIFPFQYEDGQIANKNELDDASKELRVVASKIRAHREDIPNYTLISKTGLVPSYDNTEVASINLIGWSNDIYETNPAAHERQKRRKEIASALGMRHI